MSQISIIVPVYNTEKYLHRCMDSILNQTFTDFELLLVDDGSPDNCGSICDEYAEKDNRIRVFHQENQGQAAARNHALDWVFANSDSEYISFIDSDDWVHPRYLQLLLEGIKIYDVNISQCLHIELSNDASVVVGDEICCISVEEQYTRYYSAFIWGKLFNRICWESMRFPEGQIYEDVAIWYRLLFSEKTIALVKEPLYYYFINPVSTVHKEWTPAKLAQIDAWEEQINYLIANNYDKAVQTALSRYCWVLKNQFEEIENSSFVSVKIKKQNQRVIKNKMRKVLHQYKSELKTAGVFYQYYSWAYPKIDWLYWTGVGIKGKLKRTFSR